MVEVNFIERITTGYYNFMIGKSSERYRMYLSLDEFLSYDLSNIKINGTTVSTRLVDYSKEEDRRTKELIHTDIFDVTYDCGKYIRKLSKSSEIKKGYGVFFIARDDLGNEEVIGACDLLNHSGLIILSNFGLLHKYRGKGYSHICLYNVLSSLVDRNINKVFLYVMSDNHLAIKLYKSFGFQSF